MRTLEEQIARLEREIKSIEKYLPYAEGQHYHQDTNKIVQLRKRIWELEKINAERQSEA